MTRGRGGNRFDIRSGSRRVRGRRLAEVQDGMSCVNVFDVSILQRCWRIVRMEGRERADRLTLDDLVLQTVGSEDVLAVAGIVVIDIRGG